MKRRNAFDWFVIVIEAWLGFIGVCLMVAASKYGPIPILCAAIVPFGAFGVMAFVWIGSGKR